MKNAGLKQSWKPATERRGFQAHEGNREVYSPVSKFHRFSLVFLFLIAGAAVCGAQFVAIDPTRNIPNARVLGLGKAFTALADDTGSMYTNPAGLAASANWQFTTMTGKLLDEYNYLSLSGLYPTAYGTFGMGYAGTSIGGAYATKVEEGSDPADPLYTFDTTQPVMENTNAAFIFSYAQEAAKIAGLKNYPIAGRLSFGGNIKLFRVGLTGDGITGGSASGQEVDLGLKFALLPWVNLGAVVQNLLPSNLGGILKYDSGHEESYPAVLEAGAAFNIFGKEKALRQLGNQELKIAADYERQLTLVTIPAIWHTGIEWKPVPLLSLRAGIDQDAAGDGAGGITVISDTSYGVGLNYGGFRFDYAYHTFAGAPNIDNRYFSLSYGLPARPAPVANPIVIETPADKLITFDNVVNLKGKIVDPTVKKLLINGIPMKFDLRGSFRPDVEMKPGRNTIALEVQNDEGQKTAQLKLRILRLITFPDIAVGYWVDRPISLLAMENIIAGYPDGSFRPEGNITRAEMCSLLMKSKVQSPESEKTLDFGLPTFKDVSRKHWAAPFIAQASALGVVKGYPHGGFRPNGNITRAEGLAMIARFAGVTEETYAGQFPDVRRFQWFAPIVSGAHSLGLLEYLKGKPFEPGRLLSRAETVEILHRTQFVQDLLKKDLYNWETY